MLKTIEKYEIEILAFALIILVAGISFPYHIPVFGPYVLLLFIYAIVKKKRWHLPRLSMLFLGVCILFVVGFVNSQSNHALAIRDLRNMSFLILLAALLCSFIRSEEEFKRFSIFFLRYTVIFLTLVSFVGMFKFISLLKGIEYDLFRIKEGYPWGSALISDCNFYALGGMIGLAACIYLIHIKDVLLKREWYYLFSILISVNVILAGSRRGIVVLGIMLGFTLTAYFVNRLIRWFKVSKTRLILLISFMAISVFAISQLGMKHIRYVLKPTIEMAGLDYRLFKEDITVVSYRYITILNTDIKINDYYASLWGEPSTIKLDKFKSLNIRGVDSRTMRWQYALHLYCGYSLGEKIIGSGFDYIADYSKEFGKEQVADYPHNPFLSALLYSGIIGLLALLLYIVAVSYNFLKYWREYYIYLVIFLLISMFTMISGNTFFSVKIFPAVSLLPMLFDNNDSQT